MRLRLELAPPVLGSCSAASVDPALGGVGQPAAGSSALCLFSRQACNKQGGVSVHARTRETLASHMVHPTQFKEAGHDSTAQVGCPLAFFLMLAQVRRRVAAESTRLVDTAGSRRSGGAAGMSGGSGDRQAAEGNGR